jgi:hypothetical protein
MLRSWGEDRRRGRIIGIGKKSSKTKNKKKIENDCVFL